MSAVANNKVGRILSNTAKKVRNLEKEYPNLLSNIDELIKQIKNRNGSGNTTRANQWMNVAKNVNSKLKRAKEIGIFERVRKIPYPDPENLKLLEENSIFRANEYLRDYVIPDVKTQLSTNQAQNTNVAVANADIAIKAALNANAAAANAVAAVNASKNDMLGGRRRKSRKTRKASRKNRKTRRSRK